MAVRSNKIPTAKNWKYLTIFGQKKLFFEKETYFRESWFDGYEVFSDTITSVLTRVAIVVLKPEAIAARKARDALDYLDRHGFTSVLAYKMQYNRHVIREIWRYQFSEATIDRMEVVDHLYGIGDALLLVFLDESEDIRLPASARLHALKGASEKRLRNGKTLRCALDTPNGMIRFLHVPDEPADIIRELGIIFSRQKRLEIYNSLASHEYHSRSDINKLVTELEAAQPEFKFSPERSWSSILMRTEHLPAAARRKIQALHKKFLKEENVGWDDIYSALREAGIEIYDILTVASAMIQQDIDYEFHLIDGDAVRGWDERLFA